jgi:CPA1 family monovalent cation:H+ antiporter
VLSLTTGVVVLTLVVQGFTLAPVVRRSGIALEPEHTAREESRARDALSRAGLRHLDQLDDLEAVPDFVIVHLRRHLEAGLDREDGETGPGRPADPAGLVTAQRELRRALIGVQSRELRRLYEANQVSDATRRSIQRALDLEEAGLIG